MAVVNQFQNQDDENEGATVEVAGTGGAGDSGGTGAPGAGAASPVKQDAAAQNQSGYTDVGSYLDANQAGAQKMGNDVAGNLTNKFNQTKTGAQKSANDLINEVNQGYTAENAGLVQDVANDPYAAANDPNKLAAYQQQLNSTYTGPNDWADYGTQQGKVNEAAQYGSLAGTPGGYNVYAQELEGPMASQGVNQLDTLLLRGNQDSAGAIKAAADPYSSLGSFLDQQRTAATGAIDTGRAAAKTTADNALNAFTGEQGALTGLNRSINARTAADQSRIRSEMEAALSGAQNINQRGLNAGELGALGINNDQYTTLYNAIQDANTEKYMTGHNFGANAAGLGVGDLSGYLSLQDPSEAVNASTVASKDDYAKMAAIQQLLGGKMPQEMAINPLMADQAGTAGTDYSQFDYQAALDDILNATKENRNTAQGQANTLTDQANAAHEAGKGGLMKKLKKIAPYAANFALKSGSDAYKKLKQKS